MQDAIPRALRKKALVVTVSFHCVELKLVRYSRSQNRTVRLDFAARRVGIYRKLPALERLCRLLCGKAPPFRTWATVTFSDFLSSRKAAPSEFHSHPLTRTKRCSLATREGSRDALPDRTNLAGSSNHAMGEGEEGGAASGKKNGRLDTPERRSLSAQQAAEPLVQPSFMPRRAGGE